MLTCRESILSLKLHNLYECLFKTECEQQKLQQSLLLLTVARIVRICTTKKGICSCQWIFCKPNSSQVVTWNVNFKEIIVSRLQKRHVRTDPRRMCVIHIRIVITIPTESNGKIIVVLAWRNSHTHTISVHNRSPKPKMVDLNSNFMRAWNSTTSEAKVS